MRLLIILSDYAKINKFSFLILVIFHNLTRLFLDISLIYYNYSIIRLTLWIVWTKSWSRARITWIQSAILLNLLIQLILYTRIKLTILYRRRGEYLLFLALILVVSQASLVYYFSYVQYRCSILLVNWPFAGVVRNHSRLILFSSIEIFNKLVSIILWPFNITLVFAFKIFLC